MPTPGQSTKRRTFTADQRNDLRSLGVSGEQLAALEDALRWCARARVNTPAQPRNDVRDELTALIDACEGVAQRMRDLASADVDDHPLRREVFERLDAAAFFAKRDAAEDLDAALKALAHVRGAARRALRALPPQTYHRAAVEPIEVMHAALRHATGPKVSPSWSETSRFAKIATVFHEALTGSADNLERALKKYRALWLEDRKQGREVTKESDLPS